ncbi:MAG: hypothetical protein AB1898_06585 [Acidobacteriota bacterium]
MIQTCYKILSRSSLILALGLMLPGLVSHSTGQAGGVRPVLAPSTRRPPDAPPPPPPELPPNAASVTPLTLQALIELRPVQGKALTIRQSISRTADRIHVSGDDGSEWLFERNPRDARRVTGVRIERTSGQLVVHEESELRNVLGVRGWADVLMLGFDRNLLDGLERTEETQTVGGIRFARYSPVRKDLRVQDVWWSDDQLLAKAFVLADDTGTSRFSIERINPDVSTQLIQHPSLRFPAYRLVDFPDWLDSR